MAAQHQRFLLFSIAGLALVWLLAWAGYEFAKNAKLTPEQVSAYAHSLDLSKLSAADRSKALHKLADWLNGLSAEERRGMTTDMALFGQLTEEEKAWFLEATMPTQIKQALAMFERLPEDRRQKVIDGALRDLRAQAANAQSDGQAGTNAPPQISPELEAKVRTLGLKTFYSESSAETKAELAPLLNELQLQMENGRQFRRGGN